MRTELVSHEVDFPSGKERWHHYVTDANGLVVDEREYLGEHVVLGSLTMGGLSMLYLNEERVEVYSGHVKWTGTVTEWEEFAKKMVTLVEAGRVNAKAMKAKTA